MNPAGSEKLVVCQDVFSPRQMNPLISKWIKDGSMN